jgi:hypothetical protein
MDFKKKKDSKSGGFILDYTAMQDRRETLKRWLACVHAFALGGLP